MFFYNFWAFSLFVYIIKNILTKNHDCKGQNFLKTAENSHNAHETNSVSYEKNHAADQIFMRRSAENDICNSASVQAGKGEQIIYTKT